MAKVSWKIWLLVIALIIALALIINFKAFSGGVEINDVNVNSSAFNAGIARGEILKEINGVKINSIPEFYNEVSKIQIATKTLSIQTEDRLITYQTSQIDFSIDNRTVSFVSGDSEKAGLKVGMIVDSIDNYSLASFSFSDIRKEIEPSVKIEILTDVKDYIFLTTKDPGITVTKLSKWNVKTGLDIQGGSRALLSPEKKLDAQEMANFKSVIEQRLNAYGIKDVVIRDASNPFTNEQYLIVEIAGATPKELQELISQQGKFEAKIGNDTVFVGGRGDIKHVCQGDGSCEFVEPAQLSGSAYFAKFSFTIDLSPKAAQRQAQATSRLSENLSQGKGYLNETIDLYLDDKLLDKLLISSDLKGKEVTTVTISGSGVGNSKADAVKDSQNSMKKLQTILITGSLPFKIRIEKIDTISPTVGQEFTQNIIFAIIAIFIVVCLIIYLRFRKPKIVIPVIITLASELILTLGIAALLKWNLDLPSIAGIIAAIGTGVDDQIVMIDESETSKSFGIKERIKRAFFIIFAAYATVMVSLVPLWFAGAGLLKGFALTTAIGITVGVFVTRPAFAEFLKIIKKDKD
jgi:preprotein translocase subunit SecD